MKHQSPFAIIKSEKKQRIPAIGRMVDDMKEECLICKAPLEYLQEDIEMECELCHKKESKRQIFLRISRSSSFAYNCSR